MTPEANAPGSQQPDWTSFLTIEAYQKLLRCARALLRFKDPLTRAGAGDLLNGALVRLIESPTKIQDAEHLHSTVLLIMQHSLVDSIRSAKTIKRGGQFTCVQLPTDIACHSAVPVETIAVRQVFNRLAVGQCRPAKVLRMHALDADSLREIASRLSLSVRTVKRDLATARKWARAELTPLRRIA